MHEDGDRPCERLVLGNGGRIGAVALARPAVATAVIRRRLLSRMRGVVRGDGHSGVIECHPIAGAVLTAILGALGRGRGKGGERERPGHPERKLQKQHGAQSPSSRA